MSPGLSVSVDLQLFLPFYLVMMREAFYPYLPIIDDQAPHPPGARRSGPMSIPPESPKHPLGAAQIERWVQTATNKRLATADICKSSPAGR